MSTNKPRTEEETIDPTANYKTATANPIDPTANYKTATEKGFTNPEFSATGLGAQMGSLGQKYIDMNYTDWTQGNDYASLAKRYSDQGRQAMDDTIGQMAARTGGMASSYAATAGQQTYGSWMEKLEDAARALYDSQKAEALNAYNVAAGDYDRQRGVYESDRAFDYGLYRDTVSDAQWADGVEYGAYRDTVSDAQWQDEQAVSQFNEDRTYKETTKEKTLSDFKDNIYAEFYYMDSEALKNVTFEDYREEFEALGLTERDFNNLKNSASEDRTSKDFENKEKLIKSTDAEGIGNTLAVNGTLSDDQIQVFDHYYGAGSYRQIQDLINSTSFSAFMSEADLNLAPSLEAILANDVITLIEGSGINAKAVEAVYSLIETQYPEMFAILEANASVQ